MFGCGFPILLLSISLLLYHESLPVPQTCYHLCLVELALGGSRQFEDF